MAPLRCAAKFDPLLSLDCASTHSPLAQSKERKGSNFAIWQPREGVLLRPNLADAVLQPDHVRQDDLHAEEEQRPDEEGWHPQHQESQDESQGGE